MTIERPMFPPRAESVDSFSHQPGIGQPESQNLASESHKPAERLSRRAALTGLALLPAALAASSAVGTDPVFELIEAHRAAHIAHKDSLMLQSRLEKAGLFDDAWSVSEKPCHDENDAFEVLGTAAAITLVGLSAKLAYFQELAGEFETEWMIDDREVARPLIESIVASLKNIGVTS